MKKTMFLLLKLSLVLSLTFLVACGGGKKEGASGGEKVVNSYLGSGIKTLDISKATDANASAIFTQTMEGLTRLDVDESGNDVIVPGIAESWETSEDGLKWTFKLRDAKWTDGKAVKAEDFVYSIKRTLDPKTASQYAFILAPIKNANEANAGKVSLDEVGVKALDDKTLEFTLNSPTAYFLDLTYYKTLYPQRKDLNEKFGNKYGANGESYYGNGPFKLVSWVPNSEVSLVKNENYWDAKSVKLDKLNIKIVQDTNAQMNMLFNGQVDIAGVSKKEWIEKFDKSGKFNVEKGYTAGTNYSTFNLDDKIFKNDKVRKAFSLSVDRKDMSEVIFKGLFDSAMGWVPPKLQIGGKDYRSEVPEPLAKLASENPDPKALLIEGLKELGMDPDPSKLTVTYLNAGTNEWNRKYFEYIQQMWKKTLGVTIKGEFVEWPVFQKRIDEQNFQIAGLSWIGDYNDPSTFLDMWTSTAGLYNIGFENARYDELIALAGAETDQAKRLEYFAEAENILLYEESAIAPTLYRKRNTYTNKRVKGIKKGLFGTIDYKLAEIVE